MKFARSGLLLMFFAVFATGCAGSQKVKDEKIVWPLPPMPPRIEYVKAYTGEASVREEPGFFGRIAEFVAGRKPEKPLRKPYDVVADAQGRVFVADTGWKAVVMLDSEQHVMEMWGRSGYGVLEAPTGLAIDSQGHVYVADAVQKRVVRFDPEGEFVRGYGMKDELVRPVGVAVDDERNVLYVVDTKGHQVVSYDLESGEHTGAIGQRGSLEGEFNYPTHAVVGKDGELLVMDTFNFRIQVFDTDGRYLRQFGKHCDGGGCFSRSKGLALDSEGHVYVTDAQFHVVQMFDPEGNFLMHFGGHGWQPGRMVLPAGIYIDAKDRVYVADQYNWRINVYQYKYVAPEVYEQLEAEEAEVETVSKDADAADDAS